MDDYIVRAACADLKVRAIAISAANLTERARENHNSSPVITEALGRLLMGGAMMGVMMKGENDILTVQMRGDGPAGSLLVTADSHGRVKGYAANPQVHIPPNYAGKLDVGAAIGYGEMIVTKDLGLKEPYVSRIPLSTSEVAEDLTYYFAVSEQTPSVVGLGVTLSGNGRVSGAEGFIIQMMPEAPESLAREIERRIGGVSVSEMIKRSLTPEGILQEILGDLGLEIIGRTDAAFECACSKERVARVLLAMGKGELEDIVKEGKPITVNCRFCGADYTYETEEVEELLSLAQTP